ncbi:microtubule-associated protein futsch [Panicum miliaceum]|uniref:Microtubule-associated protein futsch n=1 Tax=Panicum miliaceum TaxID=4540 RepID=A0A3L6Q651_PANMI|nr:microtubule-associated protein futsch [Panicum miliaceum]
MTFLLSQSPTCLRSRSNSTKASQKSSTQNTAPGPQEEPSQSGSNVSKLVLGTLVVGAAAMGAHQLGYIDLSSMDKKLPFSFKNPDVAKVYEDLKVPSEQMIDQTQIMSEPNTKIVQASDNEAHTPKDLPNEEVGASETPAEEKKSEILAHETHPVPDEHGSDTKLPSQDSLAVEIKPVVLDDKETGEVPHEQQAVKTDSTIPPVQSNTTTGSSYNDSPTDADATKDLSGADSTEQKSLAETYLLQDGSDVPKDAAAKETRRDEIVPEKTSEDGKVVLDIIEAIHAAEKKQADADAYIYSEEKRKLKEKYEKELKDTRARELMYAEEAAILDKELKKEKLKNAAAVRELQEKAEQKLRDELQRKDEETKQQIEKAQELAKAELAAAVAKEKATQIEQIAEANLNFNSLKETIRHFSLIPAGGGGILTHALARVASSIKIKEDNSGDGIESLIKRVESLIVDGDLSTAAEALDGGLHGSEAADIATEWVKQARKRAIAEQTLALLHACASSTTFS